MADSIEHFDQAKNVAKVIAGLKGGPFYNTIAMPANLKIVDGWPAEVKQKLDADSLESMPIQDPWYGRRNS